MEGILKAINSNSPAMRETLPPAQGHLPPAQECDEDSHNVIELICTSAVSVKSVSAVFCSFPWKFSPRCFSSLVHFSALEPFIHPPCALPLSKHSHPIPRAVICCQYFNNVAVTQLSPAPSSRCRISVLWKSLHAEIGKILPQPREKAHSAVIILPLQISAL